MFLWNFQPGKPLTYKAVQQREGEERDDKTRLGVATAQRDH
jgi:hypothetical protein